MNTYIEKDENTTITVDEVPEGWDIYFYIVEGMYFSNVKSGIIDGKYFVISNGREVEIDRQSLNYT